MYSDAGIIRFWRSFSPQSVQVATISLMSLQSLCRHLFEDHQKACCSCDVLCYGTHAYGNTREAGQTRQVVTLHWLRLEGQYRFASVILGIDARARTRMIERLTRFHFQEAGATVFTATNDGMCDSFFDLIAPGHLRTGSCRLDRLRHQPVCGGVASGP